MAEKNVAPGLYKIGLSHGTTLCEKPRVQKEAILKMN